MLRVGLTGGIASGKSLVASMFAKLGVPVIDTDQVARDVVAPGQPALQEIRAQFGPDVILPSGELDRRRLRRLIFEEDSRREALEAILHPSIRRETLARAGRAGGPYQILVVPLLVETGFGALMDRVLVVDCPTDVQRTRLSSRDAESLEQMDRMLAAQATREERLAVADDVIDNSGDVDDTRAQVEALHAMYLSMAE
ncbi:MAG: dephospho-CoA kinase [Gammaproteobacteria bacterium]|nr:dephospho-CoA kinase [Gammaproteobacteria bacterium]